MAASNLNGADMTITDYTVGHRFKFKSSNTGPVVIHPKGGKVIVLKKNGVPIQAGDIAVGEIVTFDWWNGEIAE